MRKRVDLGVLATFAVDSAQAGERVLTVNVHGARTADTLSARATESQCWVDFVLNFDQGVENLKIKSKH